MYSSSPLWCYWFFGVVFLLYRDILWDVEVLVQFLVNLCDMGCVGGGIFWGTADVAAFFSQLHHLSCYVVWDQSLPPACIEPLALTNLLCYFRYVCPVGSSSPHFPSNACPPGTVGSGFDLFDKSQCETCPAGYFCVRGTWFYGRVNGVLWYLVLCIPKLMMRAGQWAISDVEGGKGVSVGLGITTETAVPSGQVGFNSSLRFSLDPMVIVWT